MAWTALLKAAGSKAAMQSGKKMATNIAKEAAVNKVKSTIKKKKVKGKDIAKKMLGGGGESSEKGGALAIRPSSSIVSSPAGGLVPTKIDEGGSLVVKSGAADELGLTPFMESVSSIKESVKSIKGALTNNLEDAGKRLEKQRVLNARLRKKEREEELESKKPKPGLGIGKKIMKPAKDAAGNFLSKLLRFFKATLLGMFVNALVGGARDVVVAFIFGFKAYTMAKDAAVKFILGLKGKIGKGLSNAGKGIEKVGSTIGKFLGKVRSVLVGWIRNTVDVVRKGLKGAKEVGGKALKAVGKGLNWARKTKVGKAVERGVRSFIKNPLKTLNKGARAAQNFIKNPGKTLQALQKTQVGKTVTNLIKSPGKTLQGGLKAFQKTGAGKFATNLIKNPGKTLQGGLKGLQKSNIGKGATNMLGGIKNWGAKKWKGAVELGGKALKGISKWADNMAKNAMKWTDDVVKGGLEQAKKWRKQLGDIAEMVKNPMKLVEKVKGMLGGKMDKMVKNNKIIKQIMELKKDPKKIKSLVKQLGKNKNVLKTRKVLEKGAKLKIAGIDAVLAALMGIIDYTAFGESPINAALRAAGALIGYTAGFAIGAPFGGVPGFITGMAGSFVGEKAADGIAALLAETPLGSKPDPIMNDGRMLVRNPFSGQGEGERMDNIQEKQAKLSENKKEDVSQDISSSASYEDDGTEELILIDGGDQQSSSIASLGGKPGLIPIGIGKDVNSEYEMISNAALYKV